MADGLASSNHPLWTIMLYLSGDNNLSSTMIDTINAIAALDLANDVAITIQFDPASTRFPTTRYELAPERLATAGRALVDTRRLVRAQLDRELPEDSADPGTLADFVAWSITRHQSRYRMLILSGHGSGAVGDFLPDRNARGGESGSLTIPELRKALDDVSYKALRRAAKNGIYDFSDREDRRDHRIDILGMDSCLMSMAEVCHQVRGLVRYLVASEGFVPNVGWPYGHMLGCLDTRLKKGESPTPDETGRHIVDDFLRYYTNHVSADVSVDIATCDLDKHDDLQRSLCRLADKMKWYLDHGDQEVRDLIILAHWRAQSFNFEQYTDLWDFCDQLNYACSSRSRYPDISSACDDVTADIERMVGYQGSVGVDFQHTHGVSIYFPWSNPGTEALANYRAITEVRGTKPGSDGWTAFIEAYVDKTKRRPRRTPGETATAGPGTAPQLPLADWPSGSRHSPGYNKHSPGYNRLVEVLGTPLPGSMKNAPTDPAIVIPSTMAQTT